MEFLRLVAEGRVDAVRQELDTDPGLVNRTAPHPYWGGQPQPLHVAIESNQPEVFALLLDRGADVNGDNGPYGDWTPLMLALQRGRVQMQEELLLRGARVGLVEALLAGDDEAMRRSEPPAVVPNGGSLLNFAHTIDAIDHLLALGASPVQADCWGVTPAAALSRLGPERGLPLVRHLAARGAAVGAEEFARLGDIESLGGVALTEAALLAAVESRQLETAAWLLAQGLSANARRENQSRQTALHIAAWNGDARMVNLLLTYGADREALDGEHQTTPAVWARTAVMVKNDPSIAAVADLLESTGA